MHLALLIRLAHVIAIGTGIQFPVDIANGIARLVAAVLLEFDARTAALAVLHAQQHPLGDMSREPGEVAGGGQCQRVDQLHSGDPDQLPPGSGTELTSSAITWATLTPSACAWKLSRIRWRSTGNNSA